MEKQARNTIVIFGAPDHEEKAARDIATMAGCAIGTATLKGKPVHAGNAYQADGFKADKVHVYEDRNIIYPTKGIFFECGESALGEGYEKDTVIEKVFCDHHRPGDFGYGLGPDKFWEASSIGQLCKVIIKGDGIMATAIFLAEVDGDIERMQEHLADLMLTAISDHCPADGYAGRCPISPNDLYGFRVVQQAKYQYELMNDDEKALYEVIDICKEINKEVKSAELALSGAIKNKGIADLRPFGEIAQLPEAALKTGQAYVSKIPERGRDRELTGNYKIVLEGHTTPKQVEEFMAWAKTLDNRIGEPYGNPTRGFAGVVVGPISKSCPTCGEIWACANVNNCPACGIQYPEEG